MRQLFTPLLYLKIDQPLKRRYEIFYPILFGVGFTSLFFFFDRSQSMFHGTDGIITLIRNFLQILAAFFIAALAAVSAFTSDIMDSEFDGIPPKLKMKKTDTEPDNLTRRRYLALKFGYLSFATILLYLILASIPFANKLFWMSISETNLLIEVVSWSVTFLVSAFFFNILVTTFMGLHFLSERIHRPTQKPRLEE